LCPSPNCYGGKLTKMKTFEARQLSELARDESCQLIIGYKTVERVDCKKAPNNIIMSKSELDTMANLQRRKSLSVANLPNSLAMSPVNSLVSTKA
jgi:hypothetical protein